MVMGQDCYNWASIISSGPKYYVLMMCRLWGSWAQSWPYLNWRCKTKVNQVSFSPIKLKKEEEEVGGEQKQKPVRMLWAAVIHPSRSHFMGQKPTKVQKLRVHVYTRMYVHVTIDISSWDKMLIQIQCCFVKGLGSHSKLDQHIYIYISWRNLSNSYVSSKTFPFSMWCVGTSWHTLH